MSKGGSKSQATSSNPQWFDDAGKELFGYAKNTVFQPKTSTSTGIMTASAAQPAAPAPKFYQIGKQIYNEDQAKSLMPQGFSGALVNADGSPYNDAPIANTSASSGTEFKPYEPYSGQRVADLSSNQLFSGDVARSFAMDHGGYFNNAKNWINQAVTPFGKQFSTNTIDTGGFNQQAADQYMNPFIKNALDPAASEIQRAAQIAKIQQNAGQVSRGSFGGGRQAIMDSELTRNMLDKTSQLYKEGYASAFDRALAGYMQDAQRRLQGDTYNEDNRFRAFESGRDQKNREAANYLQAASSAGNLATQKSNIISQDIERLMKTGAQSQQQQQNLLDVAYQDSEAKKNWDKDQISWLSGILNGTGAKNSINVTQKPQDNTLGSLIGAAGTIGGAYVGLSDEKVKKNIKTVGYQKGHRIVEFEYKGSDQKYRGVIAQEVQKKNPDAVREQDGFLAVDYGMIGIPFEPVESTSHGKLTN